MSSVQAENLLGLECVCLEPSCGLKLHCSKDSITASTQVQKASASAYHNAYTCRTPMKQSRDHQLTNNSHLFPLIMKPSSVQHLFSGECLLLEEKFQFYLHTLHYLSMMDTVIFSTHINCSTATLQWNLMRLNCAVHILIVPLCNSDTLLMSQLAICGIAFHKFSNEVHTVCCLLVV